MASPWAGRFLEIDEPQRFVVAVIDAAAVDDTFEVVTYTLSDKGEQTVLELRQHGGNLTDEQYLEAKEGSASFLEALAKVVATL